MLTGYVVFTQQGYFVVAINPSGSTTFGQGIHFPRFLHSWVTNIARLSDLTDAIKEDWGGKPFVDLRKGWQYVLDNYPQVRTQRIRICDTLIWFLQIDKDRAVAAGASYGGYAIKYVLASNPT